MPKRKVVDRSKVVKTLIDSFRYPRKGPGMMWEAAARKTIEQGGQVMMGCKVDHLAYDKDANTWTVSYTTTDGTRKTLVADEVISSAPIRDLMQNLTPKPKTQKDAAQLKYRDFITVALILRDKNIFTDNWIYIHEPNVKVGRIQNFKSWSPEMIPDPSLNCYGLEYFCFEGDQLWTSTDASLIELAKKELLALKLANPDDILDGHVVRQSKAYPVYDDDYVRHVDKVRAELKESYPTLHLVGRNGMHKYNNQDHAMMTAMLTVENIKSGKALYDVWQVNQDAEYHESGVAAHTSGASGLRMVPTRVTTP